MSSITTNEKTLIVTGITSYVGAALGEIILANGHHLHGTIRSAANAKSLLEGRYAPMAVKGVHGIFHVASPIGIEVSNLWDEMVMPALQSTQGVLESVVQQAGPQLSAIVFTSSITTMMDSVISEDKVYTESDPGDAMVEVTKNKTPEHPLYLTAALSSTWLRKSCL